MSQSTSRVRDLPHFHLASTELAKWLEAQGTDSWWSVDGDPLLTGRLGFPCPGSDLAKALRDINKPLLLLDVRMAPAAHGETVAAGDLDEIAYRDQRHDERVFQLSWENGPDIDWLLWEDLDSGQFVDAGDEAQQLSNSFGVPAAVAGQTRNPQ